VQIREVIILNIRFIELCCTRSPDAPRVFELSEKKIKIAHRKKNQP
jgi:hypothetical protein